MTVKELIEILKKFPSDTLIVTEGYETGYEPIKIVRIIKVEEVQDRHWWDGKFEISENSEAIEVVFLNAEIKRAD